MQIQNLIECYNKLITSRYKEVSTVYYDSAASYEFIGNCAIPVDTTERTRYKAFKYHQLITNKVAIKKLSKLALDPFTDQYNVSDFRAGDPIREPFVLAESTNGTYAIPSTDIKMTLPLKPKQYVTN